MKSLRASISRRLIRRCEYRMPKVFQFLELRILMRLAARSFRLPAKSLRWGTRQGMLREYAQFTVRCMAGEREHGPSPDPDRLFSCAYRLGRKIRRITGLTDPEDLKRLVFLLYRGIEIDMTGALPGQVLVRSCYFSRYYSPGQCALMSQVDSGIISGIFGGGRLRFCRRITEGKDACAACFLQEGENDA